MSNDIPRKTHDSINSSVEEILQEIDFIEGKQHLSLEDYKDSPTDKRAVERAFTGLRQHMVNAAREAVDHETGSKPQRRKDAIRQAMDCNIIQSNDKYLEAFAFGERLAKTYGQDTKDELVYNSMQNDLNRYREFARDVLDYLN